jgi:hypothetical protein
MPVGDKAPVGDRGLGGDLTSLPLLVDRCTGAPSCVCFSMGDSRSKSMLADSRDISPDILPGRAPSMSAPPFFLVFLPNKPLSMPGFFSFLSFLSLILVSLLSGWSRSKLGRSRSTEALVEVLESSRRIFGVRVIFRVSMLSSLKKLSVLRTVPFLDFACPWTKKTFSE